MDRDSFRDPLYIRSRTSYQVEDKTILSWYILMDRYKISGRRLEILDR